MKGKKNSWIFFNNNWFYWYRDFIIITLIYIYCIQGLSIIRKTLSDGFSNWYVISGSLLGTYLSVIFWLSGFKYTLASRAAIYNELSTIMIIILASIFLKESMTKQKWIAIIFAVSGGLIVGIKWNLFKALPLKLCN